MNIIFITSDDLSGYSLGYANPEMRDLTPNFNKFAESSRVFLRAYTNAVFCQPARSVQMTGLYSFNNGSVGFNSLKVSVDTLPMILKKNGYCTAIIGKTIHYTSFENYQWDIQISKEVNKINKDLMSLLSHANKFFLSYNFDLVHRPFPESTIKEYPMPAFLEEIKTPEIQKDYNNYCYGISVLDNKLGKLLSLIDLDKTLVIFSSDHGMSFPFCKGNCYELSTNIPLMISGPNIIPGIDDQNLVSSVDLTPTILEYLNIPSNISFDGSSILPLCYEKDVVGFDEVYVQLTRMMHGPDINIRSLITKDWTYVINFDTQYPAEFVDAWGWHNCLKFPENERMYLRDKEELYLNNRKLKNQNRIHLSNIRNKMHQRLMLKMNKFNDPLSQNLYFL